MKNAFYFMLIAIFVLEIFTLLPWLFGYVKIGMMKKLRLISKFMLSQTGQQIIPIHILYNISRGKGNQEIKFGHLIKHNIRNNFLQKSCRKWSSGTSARSLFFKKELYIKLNQVISTLGSIYFSRPRRAQTIIKLMMF